MTSANSRPTPRRPLNHFLIKLIEGQNEGDTEHRCFSLGTDDGPEPEKLSGANWDGSFTSDNSPLWNRMPSMPPLRKKAVLVSALVLGSIAFLVAVLALKGPVLEQWYLWRLESEDEEQRKVAATSLGDMKSRRAIPQLVEMFKREPFAETDPLTRDLRVLRRTSKFTIETLKIANPFTRSIRRHLSYSGDALVKIGAPAVPHLNELLKESDEQVRQAAAEALNRVLPLHVPGQDPTTASLEAVFGPEHPDTAQILNNLAALYHAQGKYKEAEPLYRRALAIREKVLGPEHPDTATTLKSYSGFLRETGRLKEAEELERRADAIRKKRQDGAS